MTKTCTGCREELPIDAFSLKSVAAATGWRRSLCKPCMRAYTKAHYNANRKSYIRRAGINNVANRAKRLAFLEAYLLEHPCVDCGEADVRVLDFDHRPGVKKLRNVTGLARSICSTAIISIEIDKCDVRCANCHRRRTAERGNHRRQKVYITQGLAATSR